MAALGRLGLIFRYPAKSMAGESAARCNLNLHGLEDDRLYAFESSAAPPGMLRVSGRERRGLLRYGARVTESGVVVRAADGAEFAVDAPELRVALQASGSEFRLTRAERPQTDVRPISLISLQTVRQLEEELGRELDVRRFRANLVLDMEGGAFAEDGLVGHTLRLGKNAKLVVRERDPRCRFVTYDPADPMADPLFELMKLLDRRHQGRAGVYASVVEEGEVAVGDAVLLVQTAISI